MDGSRRGAGKGKGSPAPAVGSTRSRWCPSTTVGSGRGRWSPSCSNVNGWPQVEATDLPVEEEKLKSNGTAYAPNDSSEGVKENHKSHDQSDGYPKLESWELLDRSSSSAGDTGSTKKSKGKGQKKPQVDSSALSSTETNASVDLRRPKAQSEKTQRSGLEDGWNRNGGHRSWDSWSWHSWSQDSSGSSGWRTSSWKSNNDLEQSMLSVDSARSVGSDWCPPGTKKNGRKCQSAENEETWPALDTRRSWPKETPGAEQIAEEELLWEEGLQRDVFLLLRELGLQRHTAASVVWCEKMGAACLEEVAESSKDLAAELPLKKKERGHLERRAEAAVASVRALAAKRALFAEKSAPPLGHLFLTRERQGQKKREQKMRTLTGESSPRRPTKDSAAGAEEMMRKQRENASKRLEQQLLDEQKQKLDSVRELLQSAMEPCPNIPISQKISKLTSAIEEAGLAGLDSSELSDARQALAKLRLRQEQRAQEALCALLAALDAQKDDSFGDVAREALAGVSDAQQAEGGARAIAAVEEALQAWEWQQRRLGEVRMALHMSMARRSLTAVRLALQEAEDVGLKVRDPLVLEATAMLEAPETKWL